MGAAKPPMLLEAVQKPQNVPRSLSAYQDVRKRAHAGAPSPCTARCAPDEARYHIGGHISRLCCPGKQGGPAWRIQHRQCEHDASARHLMRQCRATGCACTCRIPLRPQKASSRGYALLMPKAMLTAAVAASPPAKAIPSALSNAQVAQLLVTGCFRQQRSCTRRLCNVPSLLM